MDEKILLEKMARALGVENVLEDIENKKEKEKRILASMNRKLDEITNTDYTKPKLKKDIKFVEEEIIIQQPEIIVEIARQPEPELPKENIVNKYVKALSKATDQNGDADKIANQIPDVYRKELDIVKKSVADFHRFAQRHSQLGGGGAGSVDELTFHTVQVTQPTYNATRKDYFIGVNYPGLVTINLPFQNLKPGRQILIKDQSGFAASNFITIATLDGSTIDGISTFQIVNSYESISLLYANGGWNIV